MPTFNFLKVKDAPEEQSRVASSAGIASQSTPESTNAQRQKNPTDWIAWVDRVLKGLYLITWGIDRWTE